MGSALRTNQPHEALPPEIYLPLVDSLFKEGRTLFAGTILGHRLYFHHLLEDRRTLLLYCALASPSRRRSARTSDARLSARARSKVKTVEAAAPLGIPLRRRRRPHRSRCSACGAISPSRAPPIRLRSLVSFSMTIAYTTGIFGRNFGSARFVVVQIFCAWAPMTAALLIYGNHLSLDFRRPAGPRLPGDQIHRRSAAPHAARCGDLLARHVAPRQALRHGDQQHAARPVHVRRQAPGRRFERQAEAAARAREPISS